MKPSTVYVLYQLAVFSILLVMSIQDIRTHTLSKRARILFLPVVLFSAYPAFLMSQNGKEVIFYSLFGAAMGFGLSEGFNLVLRKKNGNQPLFGGADVWLFGFLGFIYGAFGILVILFLANLFYGITASVIRIKTKEKRIALPLIPFMTLGAGICAAIQNGGGSIL